MRRSLVLLIAALLWSTLHAPVEAWHSRRHAGVNPSPPRAAPITHLVTTDSALPDTNTIIVKAKHSTKPGPCIQIGNATDMPLIDSFEVVTLIQGTLPEKIKNIEVRAMSGEIENLKKDEVNVLRLTPSEETLKQLREREKDGNPWLWVNAEELHVAKTSEPK